MKIEPGMVKPEMNGWTFTIFINDVQLESKSCWFAEAEKAKAAMRDFIAELKGEMSADPNSSRGK